MAFIARTKVVQFKVTEHERAAISAAADRAGSMVGGWVRGVVLRELGGTPSKARDTAPTSRRRTVVQPAPSAQDLVPEGVDGRAWADFERHRREIRKPLTDMAARKNAEILRGMTPQQQRLSVDTTIANRWTGVFPPKEAVKQAYKGKISPEAFLELHGIKMGDVIR